MHVIVTKMVRWILAWVLIGISAVAASAVQEPKQSVSQLIEQWEELNENCRGGSGDDPDTMKACDQRTGVSDRLEAMGYCYNGETTASSEWNRCK